MVDSNETEKIVNNFYLEILGRDADSHGLKYFSEKIKNEELSMAELSHIFRTCDEYRILQNSTPRKHDQNKIESYLKYLDPKDKLKVIFGGHWSNHSGWLILDQVDQDISKRLNFSDNTVDAVFTEHVIEHVSFTDVIHFFNESKRILKNGGVLRIVCPMIEKIIENQNSESFRDEQSLFYLKECIKPILADENKSLEELNLNGVLEDPVTFYLNNLFMHHDHQFIWSQSLMIKVLKSIGFQKVVPVNIGEGTNQDYCIERRSRGLYAGNNSEDDKRHIPNNKSFFDKESLVVETIK